MKRAWRLVLWRILFVWAVILHAQEVSAEVIESSVTLAASDNATNGMDLNPSFVASRTSGVAPLYVFFDAYGEPYPDPNDPTATPDALR